MGNNPINYVDPTGHWAVTIGLGGIAAAGLGVKGEIDFVFDDDGNWGFATTEHIVAPGVGWGVGGEVGLWFVDTVNDLEGLGASAGMSILCCGAELEVGSDGNTVTGIEVGLGSKGWAFSLYASGGVTQVLTYDEMVEWLQEQLERLRGTANTGLQGEASPGDEESESKDSMTGGK